jgi:GNAT superfamily N-acetyltransferase
VGGDSVVRVRLAVAGDAEAIAGAQIASWRAAYASIVPARWLDALDEADRAARWRDRIGSAALPDSPTFVADDGAVRGFVHTGPLRDDDIPAAGRAEVYTVYVHPGAWGRGIGRTLMAAVDEFWRPTTVEELCLWVFEGNEAARAFYERLGWTADGATKVDDFGDAQPVEMRYRRRLP